MFFLFRYKKFPPLLYYNEADVEMNSTHKSNDEESSAVRFSQREEHLLEVP